MGQKFFPLEKNFSEVLDLAEAKTKEKIYDILFGILKKASDEIDDPEDKEKAATRETKTKHD